MGLSSNALSVFSRVLPTRPVAAVLVALPLSLLPVLAGAVETDRITVEDPGTGVVKFKVTSEGNVTGASFIGDGAALANVAHFKGTWNSTATYNKDEVVYSGGSSYIALAQNTNAQPSLFPASWAIFAQQGVNGAPGTPGKQGIQGVQGVQGPKGDSGSPDTQAQILTKIGTQADGVVLSLQQGPTEAVTTPKLTVKNASGAVKFVATPEGKIGIGTATPANSVDIAVDEASTYQANFAGAVFTTYTNTGFSSNGFIARQARGMVSTPAAILANDTMFNIGVRGHDGTNFSAWSKATLAFKAAENWTPTAMGTYFTFDTTTAGTTTKSEKMRIGSDGNIGVGTTAPTQKLEVAGGLRLNTAAARPTCSSTIRGTFWVTQSGSGVEDVLEVCIKNATDAYVWKQVW